MLPLNLTKSAFHISGNHQTVSPPGICLSLPGLHGVLAAQFSGVTSHCRTRLLSWLAILCHESQREITGTKGRPFCQSVTLSTPILWQVG